MLTVSRFAVLPPCCVMFCASYATLYLITSYDICHTPLATLCYAALGPLYYVTVGCATVLRYSVLHLAPLQAMPRFPHLRFAELH